MKNRLLKLLIFFVMCMFATGATAQIKSSKSRIRINNLPEPKDTTAIIIIQPALSQERVFVTEEKTFQLAGEVDSGDEIYQVLINGEPQQLDKNFFYKTIELGLGSSNLKISLMSNGKLINDYSYKIFFTEPVANLAGSNLKPGKYYALIIGINEYPGMDDNLDNAVRDATSLYELLSSKYLFDKQDMQLIINPGREEFYNAFERLATKVGEEDNLLIFYAGHGYWDAGSELGYWLPSDARLTSRASWFPNSSLVDYLKAIKSKHTLLVSDACFSGSIFKTRSVLDDIPKNIEEIYRLPSRKAITSGTLSEVPDESVFIKYLLDRLENNTDKYLSSESLFFRIRQAVENNSVNIPRTGVIQGVGDEGGDFIFILKQE